MASPNFFWVMCFINVLLPNTAISSSLPVEKSDRQKCLEAGTCTVVGDMIIMDEEMTGQSGVSSSWPDGVVPYVIDKSISRDRRKVEIVNAGIEDINSKTCITLRPATESDRALINIATKENGCFSTVGYQRRKQDVNLGNGCFIPGIVSHEIIHALGYYHEHARADRDEFVQINYKNIERGKSNQFDKKTRGVQYYGVPYNYDSIMHYPKDAFSQPRGSITIRSLNNKKGLGDPNNIGQRDGLSQGDIDMINNKYTETTKCSNRKRNSLP